MVSSLPTVTPQFTRRGACPTLHAPMQTGDGLLARLRIVKACLSPSQLGAIARLARQHGNGLVEVTARGNLQVRGLRAETQEAFANAAEAIVQIEDGLVVDTSPLAGDDPHELADPTPLVQAIRRRAEPLSSRLGPKVSVVVDGGGQISLAALKCDIRLTARGSGQWKFSAGDSDAEMLSENLAVSRTALVLEQLASLGPTARAADLAYHAARPIYAEAPPPIGEFVLRNGRASGIALPFGSATAQTIERLANIATDAGVASFRLAPQHGILAIDGNPAFVAGAMELGLIANWSDPRLRVSACIGSEGCASGHIPSRLVAERLAPKLKADDYLHVSGCAKGCAFPRRAEVTIVGRPDGHGLVIDGKAGDTPQAILRADQLESALAAR